MLICDGDASRHAWLIYPFCLFLLFAFHFNSNGVVKQNILKQTCTNSRYNKNNLVVIKQELLKARIVWSQTGENVTDNLFLDKQTMVLHNNSNSKVLLFVAKSC